MYYGTGGGEREVHLAKASCGGGVTKVAPMAYSH